MKRPYVYQRAGLALSLSVIFFLPTFQGTFWAQEPTSPDAMPLPVQVEQPQPPASTSEKPEPNDTKPSTKLSRGQRRAVLREQRRELAELEATPPIPEILRLQWNAAPLQGLAGDVDKIGLEKVLSETAQHSLAVLQAEAQIKDAEIQAKELLETNPLLLLNPVWVGLLKQAGAANIQAAKSHAQAAKQKALLESAKLYSALTQAYLAKYLAFQSIEQGRNQLTVSEQRFISGETDRFDLTLTQMALIERYNTYLSADDAYFAASVALDNQVNWPDSRALIPEEVSLQDEKGMVPTLKLLPNNITLEKSLKAAQTRPESQEFQFRKEALQKLIKASSGQDKHAREANLRQLELQMAKGADLVSATTTRSYAQYLTAQKSLQLAQQRYTLATQFVYQLQVSNKAGFSSSKDVLDGQLELARAKSSLINACLNYNLSQIQLVYEMGMLQADLISHPVPPNAL